MAICKILEILKIFPSLNTFLKQITAGDVCGSASAPYSGQHWLQPLFTTRIYKVSFLSKAIEKGSERENEGKLMSFIVQGKG
jgi:hypothetical protein